MTDLDRDCATRRIVVAMTLAALAGCDPTGAAGSNARSASSAPYDPGLAAPAFVGSAESGTSGGGAAAGSTPSSSGQSGTPGQTWTGVDAAAGAGSGATDEASELDEDDDGSTEASDYDDEDDD